MKAFVITNNGFEDICKNEIDSILETSTSKITKSLVFFEADKKDLIRIAYKSQSTKKVLIFLKQFAFSDLEDLKSKSKVDVSKYASKEDTFAVRATTINSEISSYEVERAVGNNIDLKVDLKNPDLKINVYILENKCYIGIDIVGIDLSKRDYKIFSHPKSVKGTLAYFLLKRANYSGKGLLLDPMSGSGTIIIEAALIQSKKSHNFYRKKEFQFVKMKFFENIYQNVFDSEDKLIIKKLKKESLFAYDNKLPSVNSVKKNAKIAGLSKFISQGRGEVDWIDTKFDKNSVNYIVSNPPLWTKFNTKNNTKLFEQLFSRSKEIIKKKGVILLLTNSKHTKEIALKNNFILNKEWTFKIGDRPHMIYSFSKNNFI